ncbi:hypothetical protein [Arthrobacter sp. EPSL27]|uniref:hypothetical protein n=1 Tax=Arthrobacter sp. EPSL27 TaxID=1745378 RepID=UPI00074A28B7|nr:hypothetical protein [Arthrobacter sp. EPSL27]KUM41181.1 hypothetical protein AR539_00650 [Arthrobacter sp. EPSL27]
MHDVEAPQRPAEHEEGTFILLPVIGEPDAQMAVFSDGSYSRWLPKTTGQAWSLGISTFASLGLMDVLNAVPWL